MTLAATLRRLFSRVPGWLRSEAATARRIEALLDGRAPRLLAASGVPGLAAVVGLPSGARVRRFHGFADPRGGRRMEASTVFRVLSISKPVAALGVVRLAEHGVLDLDAPLLSTLRGWVFPAERLGGFDPAGITLRRLLSHTAGLAPVEFPWGAEAAEPVQLLGAPGVRLVGPPGGGARYSNAGYVLAQLAVEEATGSPFARVLGEGVLRLLGMTRSAFDEEPWLAAGLAVPHDGAGRPLDPSRRPASAAASGLCTTADDLATALLSLVPRPGGEPCGRGVVSPAGAALLTADQTGGIGPDRWTLGLPLREREGETVLTHGGFRQGWWNMASVLLRRRAAVVLLSNGEGGVACVKPLLKEIRKVLLRMREP